MCKLLTLYYTTMDLRCMFRKQNILFYNSVISTSKRYIKSKKDPGISKRQNLVNINPDTEDNESFDDLASDFMQLHKTHKEHVREMELLNEKLKYQIVGEKYFKEKYPNFLTWHDKEQIKYLHSTDPEEWSVEKLSEGFPALPHVISKIVRSTWRKNSQQKIINHDNAVQNNWTLFLEGKLTNLSEELSNHLKKFTDRAVNLKPFIIKKGSEQMITGKNISNEFSEIISSYQNLKKKQESDIISIESSENSLNTNNTSLVEDNKNLKDGTNITLSRLESNIKRKIKYGKEVSDVDKHIVEQLNNKPNESHDLIVPNKLEEIDLIQEKYTSCQVVEKSVKDLSHLIYPERIVIPKNLKKKGCTYKLNDCYYDDDGEFLYRVPGMG